MKIDIVKPIAPRNAISSMPRQPTSPGNVHQPSRIVIQLMSKMPTGLPTSRPSKMPDVTAASAVAPS